MGEFALVRGRAMRATKTNGCGNPVPGPKNVVTTEGFISVGLTANNEAGEAISITNAAGKVCVQDKPTPKFVNYTVAISFCGVNPELVTMLTGQPLVLNAAGTAAVGFRVNSKIDVDLQGFALELWTGIAGQACTGGAVSYGYLLLPFLKGGTLGDLTVENGAVNFTLTGAETKDGAGWGVGPYNVVAGASGAASPLKEVITFGDHLHMEVTTIAPPTNLDGSTSALGVPATTAVAGSPGTTTPANSYPPATLATIGSLTASPTTAWTATQYIVLQDGTRAKWNGTAWVAA